MSDHPDHYPEPPLAGSESEHLLGSLERLRWTFRWKADGLDDAGLATRLGSSSMSLGGLLKHLAAVEDRYSSQHLDGSATLEDWPPLDEGTNAWEFASAGQDPAALLYGRWDRVVARARDQYAAAIAAGGLDQPVAIRDDDGNAASLRRLLCDLLEELGRHTGHADLLREEIDGRVGEDAPPEWRPTG